MPLPIPLSVILSPNHIIKTVPQVDVKTEENMKNVDLIRNALSGI
jgi:hypothetical protein